MKVGFIGLGNMGLGMAANLLKAGHEVTAYNRTAGKAQALAQQGARYAAQVADACRGDAVITMLADDGAAESVVFGEKGVIDSLGKGAIHVSSSTISVGFPSAWLRRTQRPASGMCRPRCLDGRRPRPLRSYLSSPPARRRPWKHACRCSKPSDRKRFASEKPLPLPT